MRSSNRVPQMWPNRLVSSLDASAQGASVGNGSLAEFTSRCTSTRRFASIGAPDASCHPANNHRQCWPRSRIVRFGSSAALNISRPVTVDRGGSQSSVAHESSMALRSHVCLLTAMTESRMRTCQQADGRFTHSTLDKVGVQGKR